MLLVDSCISSSTATNVLCPPYCCLGLVGFSKLAFELRGFAGVWLFKLCSAAVFCRPVYVTYMVFMALIVFLTYAVYRLGKKNLRWGSVFWSIGKQSCGDSHIVLRHALRDCRCEMWSPILTSRSSTLIICHFECLLPLTNPKHCLGGCLWQDTATQTAELWTSFIGSSFGAASNSSAIRMISNRTDV